MIVTRFAPSPTGLLHLGHAFAAITAHESGDDFLLRIEDIDKTRSRDAFIQSILHDLKWLGLSWDEPTLRQSTRMGAYAEALVNLKARGLVYPCFCTRAEIAAEIARAGEAPHLIQVAASGPGLNDLAAPPPGPLYPGTCRALSHEEGMRRMAAGDPASGTTSPTSPPISTPTGAPATASPKAPITAGTPTSRTTWCRRR